MLNMKTLHWRSQENKIVNISEGTPHSLAPEGIQYFEVEDNFYVGVGWVKQENTWVDPSPKPEIIPEPNWLAFNLGLLEISGYKLWEKTIKKSTTDDVLYFERLFVAFALERVANAQYWYGLIVSKPSAETRAAANALAVSHNIKMVF